MNASISEFERTKPTETMKKINSLLAFLQGLEEREIFEQTGQHHILKNIIFSLEDIKQSFKEGL
jgi:hypothetical protein